MSSTIALFRDYFGLLDQLPCWEGTAEFGTWLSLRFGKPSIRVREGNPHGESERQRRRRVFVDGEFLLWFEMGEWEFFENGKRRYHSAQARSCLRRAAFRLQSQCVKSVEYLPKSNEAIFEFDLGARLVVRPQPDAEPDDSLWHLHTPDRCLTLLADGTLKHGYSTNKNRKRLKARRAIYQARAASIAAEVDQANIEPGKARKLKFQ